jgi:hypothetical protein
MPETEALEPTERARQAHEMQVCMKSWLIDQVRETDMHLMAQALAPDFSTWFPVMLLDTCTLCYAIEVAMCCSCGLFCRHCESYSRSRCGGLKHMPKGSPLTSA